VHPGRTFGRGVDARAVQESELRQLSVRRANRLIGHQPALRGSDAQVEDGAECGGVCRREPQLVPKRHGQEWSAPEPERERIRGGISQAFELGHERRVVHLVGLRHREHVAKPPGVVLEESLLPLIVGAGSGGVRARRGGGGGGRERGATSFPSPLIV